MKDTLKIIKKMGLEFLNGVQEILIKVNLKMI